MPEYWPVRAHRRLARRVGQAGLRDGLAHARIRSGEARLVLRASSISASSCGVAERGAPSRAGLAAAPRRRACATPRACRHRSAATAARCRACSRSRQGVSARTSGAKRGRPGVTDRGVMSVGIRGKVVADAREHVHEARLFGRRRSPAWHGRGRAGRSRRPRPESAALVGQVDAAARDGSCGSVTRATRPWASSLSSTRVMAPGCSGPRVRVRSRPPDGAERLQGLCTG